MRLTERDPERRLDELTEHERRLADLGIGIIAGIDEAGRGSLAGPVVAACVVFKTGTWIPGVDDSKRLTARKREALYDQICSTAAAVGVGVADVGTIERINILGATKDASVAAFSDLGLLPQHVFTDSLMIRVGVPVTSLVRADSRVYCVAAASIVAKVTRDRIMKELDEKYPEYGFGRHKGYGTAEHRRRILEYGLCPAHRPTFLRKLLSDT